jgi:hypothetical protein
MTAYRFYYYETKECTRVIMAKSYWQAVYEFNKGNIRAWRVEVVE